MSDLKIEDATPDTEVTGIEKIPVSDAGMPKCLTVGKLKDFVMANIAAAAKAGSVDIAANAVYIEKDGNLVRIDASVFANAVISLALGKPVSASLSGNEYFTIKNGQFVQTVSMTQIRDWLKGNLGREQIAALDTAGALADEQFAMVSQTGTDKKVTMALVKAFCLAGLYANAVANDEFMTEDDELLCFKSGTLTRVKVKDSEIGGNVRAPAEAAAGSIPLWGEDGKTLSGSREITDEVAATPGGEGRIPTEAAVRSAIAGSGFAKAPSAAPASGMIPRWGGNKSLTDGLQLATSVTDAATDTQVPTAKAVKKAIDAIEMPTVPPVIQYLDASAGDDNIPSSNAVIRLVDELRESIPEDIDGRVNFLTNKSVQDFSFLGVLNYREKLRRVGYPKGTMAICKVYYNNTVPAWNYYLYINIGDASNDNWKVAVKLDRDYPTE